MKSIKMKRILIIYLKLLITMVTIFLVNAWLSGCDTVDEDFLGGDDQIDLQVLEAHTLPDLPAVIDLLTGINSTVPITVRISEQPLSGELEFLEEAIVSYEPQIDFEGDDSFTYEISSEKIKPVMNQVNPGVFSSSIARRGPRWSWRWPPTAGTARSRSSSSLRPIQRNSKCQAEAGAR